MWVLFIWCHKKSPNGQTAKHRGVFPLVFLVFENTTTCGIYVLVYLSKIVLLGSSPKIFLLLSFFHRTLLKSTYFGVRVHLFVDIVTLCQIHQTNLGRGQIPPPLLFGNAMILTAPICKYLPYSADPSWKKSKKLSCASQFITRLDINIELSVTFHQTKTFENFSNFCNVLVWLKVIAWQWIIAVLFTSK